MWDAFKDAIFYIIEFFYNFCLDWGLAIIIVTLIFRLILFPLMQKQIKSSYQMQKFNPLMQELQQKYADDQQRLAVETQKLYAESGFNPIAGCLPMLLQMPIFIALFQVLNEMGSRTGGTDYSFYNILPNLIASPATMFGVGVAPFIPYLILLLIFAGCTFLPSMLMLRGQSGSQQKQQMIMMGLMSLFMLWIGWGSPAGVLLFWGVSSLFGVFQQQITMRVLKRRDAEEEEAQKELKPIEVEVTRKVKKPRPTKSKK